MRVSYASAKLPRPLQMAALPPAPTPQPVAPAPIRFVFDDRTGQPDDDGDFARVRDDLVAVAFWHGRLGESMPPLTKPPSRQAGAGKAVQEALTNLAVKQTIRSPR